MPVAVRGGGGFLSRCSGQVVERPITATGAVYDTAIANVTRWLGSTYLSGRNKYGSCRRADDYITAKSKQETALLDQIEVISGGAFWFLSSDANRGIDLHDLRELSKGSGWPADWANAIFCSARILWVIRLTRVVEGKPDLSRSLHAPV